jgi:hypothetical protein
MIASDQEEISAGEEFKEVFAHMGAALAHFQLLELHLAPIVAFIGRTPRCHGNYLRLETEARGSSYKQLAKSYSEASSAVPALADGLLKHADFRNALAHRFFIENMGRIYGSSESRVGLCNEVKGITDQLVDFCKP